MFLQGKYSDRHGIDYIPGINSVYNWIVWIQTQFHTGISWTGSRILRKQAEHLKLQSIQILDIDSTLKTIEKTIRKTDSKGTYISIIGIMIGIVLSTGKIIIITIIILTLLYIYLFNIIICVYIN